MVAHNSGGRRRASPQGLIRALVLVLSLLAFSACGGAGGSATVAVPAATGATGAGASAERIEPVAGKELGGQDRVGAPGLGTFLFFDAEG
jgi:hypothetical protein